MGQPIITADRPRGPRPTGSDVRQLLMGRGIGDLVITRQAYRVRPTDTDEVLALGNGRDHWVANRVGDRIAVWALMDEHAAAEKFEQLTGVGDGWVEARPEPEASPAA